ncbi:MAG: membrane protein insertase YidC [Helicobacteraceae bacterium]|nr:membrane protein insertase YidC [Helicobacteraceae bacterium]
MLEKLSPAQRLIIFFLVLFVFFALYNRYIVQPQAEAQQAAAAAQLKAQEPQIVDENAAPIVQNDLSAPSIATAQTPFMPDPTPALARVKTAVYDLAFDKQGRVRQVTLTNSVFTGEDHKQLELLDPSKPLPLELRFNDRAIHQAANSSEFPYSASADFIDASEREAAILLTQTIKDLNLTITKEIVFYPDGHYDLKVNAQGAGDYFVSVGFRPSAEIDPMTVQGVLVEANGKVDTIEDGEAKTGNKVWKASMVSAFDRYYASLLYNYGQPFDVYMNAIGDNQPLAFVHGVGEIELGGYIGPKYVSVLASIHPNLTNAVEYGFFTFLSRPLFTVLEWIKSIVPNWGWSIVIFTLLVKILLFPLSHKGMVSMAKLKHLAPRMKELQERYKDDKQKLQVHMMELYKRHGANPLGGCLPLLMQIPIFFAIYRVLLNAIELKGASWLYIGDLSLRDPFFVLPILMGATMWFQQRIAPSNFTDPIQEKIFKYLPLIFTAFFLFFPAGLVLYWLVNNLVSIAQQWYVNRRMALEKTHSKEEKSEKN